MIFLEKKGEEESEREKRQREGEALTGCLPSAPWPGTGQPPFGGRDEPPSVATLIFKYLFYSRHSTVGMPRAGYDVVKSIPLKCGCW